MRCSAFLLTGLLLLPLAAAAAPALAVRPLRLEFDGRWIGDGVAYSPYRAGQSPMGAAPSAEQILEDLRILSRHWQIVRMYDANASAATTLALIREHRLPLRLVLGAWIGRENNAEDLARNRARVDAAIRLAREFSDIVVALNIGNETQVHWSDHPCDPDALIAHLRATRAAVTQPVTTADDFKFWTTPASRRIAAEVDFIMLHAYALWHGRPLAEAMTWVAGVYDEVCRLHPDRQVVLAETGWATAHDPKRNGPGEEGTLIRAETSVAAQTVYLRQHYRWLEERRVATFLFEAFDEPWKGRGATGSPDEVEKNWGVFDQHRRPKPSFLTILEERQRRGPAAPRR